MQTQPVKIPHIVIMNGQMFENGKKIVPQIGNLQHIEALRRAEVKAAEEECPECGESFELGVNEHGKAVVVS